MYAIYDPDEWESVLTYSNGEMFGLPFVQGCINQRRRDPEEVARIKAEKRRVHEDSIIAQAAAIQARRAETDPGYAK